MPYRMLIPVVAAVLVAFAGCAEPESPGFVSEKHKFKVRFGGDPKVGDRTRDGVKATSYTVENTSGVFTVTVTELPIPDDAPPDSTPRILNQAKDDLIRGGQGQILTDQSTTLAGKYPGREFSANFLGAQPGLMRVRIYIAGKRLYQVMAVGTQDYASSPTATAFLDSFMVLE